MSHINTLRIYEDLITSGIPEKQAKAQVHAIENFITDLATKDDLSSVMKMLEKDLKIFFGYLVGGTIIIAILIPIILKLFGF